MTDACVHCCRGIIYRDVKPDNFLYLTPQASSVKATDFGLSIR
jgi:serine/threonine protein kinase